MTRKRKNRVYFTKEAEQAIVKYNRCSLKENFIKGYINVQVSGSDNDIREYLTVSGSNNGLCQYSGSEVTKLTQELESVTRNKDQIYREEISYPLNKLSENIINRFKFPYYYDSTENIQREVVSFLVSVLHKYHEDKGRAFSYFSVVAKNHLILTNRAKYEHTKSHKSITDDLSFDIIDEDELEKESNEEVSEFVLLMLEFWENNINTIFKKQKDIMVAHAVLELFRKAGNIENFNKKALYIMIREMTGVKTQYITNVVNKMKVYIAKMVQEYDEHGIFDTENIDSFFDG